MREGSGLFWRSYAKLVGTAFLLVSVLAGVGYWPTVQLAGMEAVPAMIAGCLVSWLASCVGAVPLALAPFRPSTEQASSILISTGLRFLVVLVLVAPIVLSGWFPRVVFVSWVAMSYLPLLIVDTAFAVRLTKRLTTEKMNE